METDAGSEDSIEMPHQMPAGAPGPVGSPVGWDQWIAFFGDHLNFAKPAELPSEPLHVMTLCSGSDAPIYCLEKLFGPEAIVHTVSCDRDSRCREFIFENFRPRHLFDDVSFINRPAGRCYICGGMCRSWKQERCDIIIAGFPCTPFSDMNTKRWDPSYDPWSEESAQPFLRIREFLDQGKGSTDLPSVCILENVSGCVHRDKHGNAPVDFIMNGTIGGKKYGLTYLSKYYVFQSPMVDCKRFGLPIRRKRLFWILLKKDTFSDRQALDFGQNLQNFDRAGMSMPMAPIVSLDLFATDHLIKQGKYNVPLSDMAMQRSNEFRQAHGLPMFGNEGAHPYSQDQANQAALGEFTLRELDVLDCMLLYCEKKLGGIPNWFAIDVSQSVTPRTTLLLLLLALRGPPFGGSAAASSPVGSGGRSSRPLERISGPSQQMRLLEDRMRLWPVGSVNLNSLPTPCTKAKIVFNGRLVTQTGMMNCLGWNQGEYEFPDGFTVSDARRLVGNIISPPVLGGVLMAIFGALPVGALDCRMAK
eukprot:2912303-Pyramimonas_sp.AAC.2